jgi:hypothetical protein
MSDPVPHVPVSIVADDRPREVVIIGHSPLFYWWPVWTVGFLMAGLSWWQGHQVAFVPPGTVAERHVQVPGHEGPRDVLVVPAGQTLPAESESDELMQPRMRMAASNSLGIVWAMTLLIVVVATHVTLRGAWSVVALVLLAAITLVFAVFGLWEPILRSLRFIDIHINALGYLSISLFLFVIWLLMFLVFDRLKYMIFTRGRLRVRKAIGDGEKVFDMRGMVFQRHRDDMFRHWLLGFGTADLTVFTSGANAQQIEMPNVIAIHRKLALINKMLQELEVTKGR